MSRDNYSQRLKEIRQKYGSTLKEPTTTHNLTTKQFNRSILNTNDKYEKYGPSKIGYQDSNWKTNRQLQGAKFHHTHTNSFMDQIPKQSNFSKQFDTSSNYKKDQRLKQIDQIRQQYAETRNKTIEDWTRDMQKSRKNYKPIENYGLRERINELPIRNPEMDKISLFKQDINSVKRNRAQSHCMKNEEFDHGTKLKRNYQYPKQQIRDSSYQLSKELTYYRQCLKNQDKENIVTSVIRQFDFSSKNLKKQESQTTSPIRGLMKFDSIEKNRNLDNGQKNYNLANIDRIQERIQKILNSK